MFETLSYIESFDEMIVLATISLAAGSCPSSSVRWVNVVSRICDFVAISGNNLSLHVVPRLHIYGLVQVAILSDRILARCVSI